ncbi:hypothetical protein [Afifella sp. YEN Y35]
MAFSALSLLINGDDFIEAALFKIASADQEVDRSIGETRLHCRRRHLI